MSKPLRLGLLVCDHVSSRFIDVAGDYTDMMEELFAGHPDVELVAYDVASGEFPASPDECDAWITTGSRRSVYEDEEWIEGLAGVVRSIAASGRPFVGICFGHQMIAHALGGKVERSAGGWGVGLKEVEVWDRPDWLERDSFLVLNSHADQIVDLPPGGRAIGGNDHCPVSLMVVGDKMVGFQGHPEFPRSYSEALIRARRGTVLAEDVSDEGLRSLDRSPDRELLAQAIVDFIRRP